jgi:hypothetical protein
VNTSPEEENKITHRKESNDTGYGGKSSKSMIRSKLKAVNGFSNTIKVQHRNLKVPTLRLSDAYLTQQDLKISSDDRSNAGTP